MPPRIEETSKSGTLANDNWRAVVDLLGLPPWIDCWVIEGFLSITGNPATFMLVPKGGAAPSGSSGGDLPRQAPSMSTFGPASTLPEALYKGYPLARLWVRNTTAGANATLGFEGTVRVE